ncbi:SDR family NAD(P)-dependent oxidoreductase [Novosphingobium sp. PC22D]|uniref:SDR family NAD(P)-dependent oxidoreductase n=1 Tax=Novosphingobium sp. PC22D TaxID=1962403 RepID=UPI001438E78E|nr:SDR family NAD(P)-dependent oxidoreductase [Novosphingobium sp. PC22D]
MSDDEIRFDGRVALVTGGGRGIGRALSLLLASRGANVVVADSGAALDGAGAEGGAARSVVSQIEAQGGTGLAFTGDLATEQSCGAAIASALDAFGRIDAIAHNASTSPELRPADQLSTRDLEGLMRINPMAALWLARHAWPHMVRQRYGRLVLASSAGIYGSFGNAHYAAAKAAIIGVVRCLALEGAAHGITVNGVAPSARTRMTERLHDTAYSRWLLETMAPEHVAAGSAFLLSEACALNGETISLGGGRIARLRLAESEGVMDVAASPESVGEAMPATMADERMFYPDDLSDRSARVARLFCVSEKLDSSASIAVKPG